MEIKDFPRKLVRDATDRLLIQAADDSVWHIESEAFIDGISGGGGATIKYALIQDQKSNGTDGGAAVGGAWTTRTLNTVVSDPDSLVSLSANAFTLAAGTYILQALASLWSDSGIQQSAQARIFNVSDGTIALLGLNSRLHIASGSSGQLFSPVNGLVTITTAKAFRLEQYFQSTFNVSRALGLAGNFGNLEIYSEVQIWKTA